VGQFSIGADSAGNLPQANGANQIVSEVGSLVGPAIGGLALAHFGRPGEVLLADAASYLISVVCIVGAQVPTHPMQLAKSSPMTVGSLFSDFYSNYRGIICNRSLKLTILYSALCILFVGAALRVLIPSVIRQHNLPDSFVGYAMSATAIGTIAGALVCTRVLHDFGTRRLMLCWAIYGAVLAAFPAFAATLLTIVLASVSLGVAGAFVDVVLPTNIQQLSDDGSIGKNFSFFSTLANTGEALSAVLASGIVIATSVGSGIVLIGAAVAVVGCIGRYKAAPTRTVSMGVLP
jgi:DHA3 family macrolide efflux protein-like MFS transporter